MNPSYNKEDEEKFLEENKSLVYHVMKKMNLCYDNLNYLYEDVFQEGMIGLLKAYRSFDSSKNNFFSTFAFKCIKNEIMIFFRNIPSNNSGIRFPYNLKLLINDASKSLNKNKYELNEEDCKLFNINYNDYLTFKFSNSNINTNNDNEEDLDDNKIIDLFLSNTDNDIIDFEIKDLIDSFFKTLENNKNRERYKIIFYDFYINHKKCKDIADDLGISIGSFFKLKKNLINKLKEFYIESNK